MQSLLQMVGTLLVTATTTLATLGGGVGIGTTTISELLTVNGNIHVVSSTAGVVFPDGTKQITAPASLPLSIANGGTATSTTPGNGQLLIGNGTNYSLNTLTAGTSTVITNAAGNVTIASNITSKARASIANTVTVTSTAKVIAFDTEQYDNLNEFSTSTGVFTISQGGYYQVNANLYWSSVPVDQYYVLNILKNGSVYSTGVLRAATNAVDVSQFLGDIIQASAGDTISVSAQAGASTNLSTGAAYSYVSIHKLSD